MVVLISFTCFVASCSDDDNEENASIDTVNQFDNMKISDNLVREKIVVISDIHLGADLSYSENTKHLSRLEQFLNEVRKSQTVKELVIGGDMLDGWYIPTRSNSYAGGAQVDFVKRIAKANRMVIDAICNIIKEGKIKVTYVPGNHDMLFTASDVESIMPGIHQARDANRPLLGTYYPDGFPQIAIEHGHRYDFFSNLDPYDNQDIAPGTILPPGYFFARIAANSFVNQIAKSAATQVPAITLNSTTLEQKAKYLYYYGWKYCLDNLIWVNDNFDEKIIVTHLDGFTDTLSVKDILPYNDENGLIQTKMYKDAFTQENWNKRLRYNNVPVMTNVADAVIGSLKTQFIDNMSNVQYFNNPQSNVRIVVFGHTHIPMMRTYTNAQGEACVYVNTGTWEDKKLRTLDAENGVSVDQDSMNMDFAVITPRDDDKSAIYVGLYKYNYGTFTRVADQSIK